MRLTVAQALVRFLAVQYSERDGVEQRLIAGCFGIFGHGNVAGVGQALLEAAADELPFYHARNEQAMVHTAVGYARQKNRLSTLACTSSIGPGATNMVTGAALATINRLPVLLLPGDVFATRAAGTVLQELEDPTSYGVSVNDTLSRSRGSGTGSSAPSSSRRALLAAMRVLTDPAETGAVTLALPQDVQAEAFDWPDGAVREARLADPAPAARAGRRCTRPPSCCAARAGPLIVAGGGTIYAEATDALRELAEATGIAVGETQAGKGSLPYDHPQALGRDRRHRHDRGQRRRSRGRRGPRRRHPLERLHDGVAQPLQRGRPLHQPQRRRRSTPSSTPGCRSSPTPGSGSRRSNEALDGELRAPPPTTGTRRSSSAYTTRPPAARRRPR